MSKGRDRMAYQRPDGLYNSGDIIEDFRLLWAHSTSKCNRA